MAKDPAQRFQTAEAMVAGLVRAATPSVAQPPAARSELVALNLNRPIQADTQRPPAWRQWPESGRAMWQRTSTAAAQAIGQFKGRAWNRLTPRQRIIAGYGAFGVLALLLLLGSITSGGPARRATATPTAQATAPATVSFAHSAPTWASSVEPMATSAPAPTAQFTPTSPKPPPSPSPSPTSEWTWLPSSAAIRPGIYVKIVRPAGLDLSKEAGFDKDFITTLPAGRVVYVVAGPTRANTLNWIKVTDGATTGWGVQDYVTPYGIRNTP
jgi:hypothetical protein